MAKTTTKPTEDLASKYLKEFSSWRTDLQPYWKQIDKNQEMYEFYQSENDQESVASMNTPFAIVESMISKANEATLQVTTSAIGTNDLNELETWVASVVKHVIEDPDVAQFKGTFRKIREKFFREFLVKGNAVATVDYLYQTQVTKEGKQILADNPYCRVRDLKSVVFNPAKTLADSDVYYLESYVKFSDLKGSEYDEKTGKGLYKNLGQLKIKALDENKVIDDDQFLAGEKKVTKKVEPIRLIERWKGAKYCVIADVGDQNGILIREEVDPLKIGGHNLLIAMNYVVGERPYAYGEIDVIYQPVKAQDRVLQQSLDIVDKYLKPNVLVKDTNVDLNELIILINEGGVMYGDPQTIGNVPSQLPPSQAFTTIDLMQQGVERAARYSPYAAGNPSSATDTTKGTATGVTKMIQANEPNFQIKLDALEDSFMRPYARTCLKMVANLMSATDIRYGLLEDKKPTWIKATKNVLQGKFTFKDAVDCGLMTEEDVIEFTMMDDGMGNLVPIPGIDKAIVVDVDWLINVKLDNQSAVDKQEKTNRKVNLIKLGMEMGVQFDPQKAITRIAQEDGFEDIEDLFNQQPMMQQVQQPVQQGVM